MGAFHLSQVEQEAISDVLSSGAEGVVAADVASNAFQSLASNFEKVVFALEG